ncbi:hypothetical protein PCH_Pc21g01680 [Penicillium rubens Wisconsin 54-1255]|uniref:Uncharacterized protein n=1 Tax=Penicillium rubens (strain ATCC 28089 / DSM 1075 / NRRL 1951 / Wisconsin 54-1255) TaxID=500485 RepID=B6HIU3_PENRW|nr:hypothetical protein PCH_Pc21g01680 [Penicillium rubens Wisconsin 54-1255]
MAKKNNKMSVKIQVEDVKWQVQLARGCDLKQGLVGNVQFKEHWPDSRMGRDKLAVLNLRREELCPLITGNEEGGLSHNRVALDFQGSRDFPAFARLRVAEMAGIVDYLTH